jgi:hypothetical protein
VAGLSAATEKEPEAGVVRGVLVEKDSRATLGNAVVSLINLGTGKEYLSSPTDKGGRFEIGAVPEGRYRLEVAAGEGRVEFLQSVFIKANEVADFNLDVAPADLRAEWGVARGVYVITEVMCRPRPPVSPWKPPGKPPWVPGPPPWVPGPPPWHSD